MYKKILGCIIIAQMVIGTPITIIASEESNSLDTQELELDERSINDEEQIIKEVEKKESEIKTETIEEKVIEEEKIQEAENNTYEENKDDIRTFDRKLISTVEFVLDKENGVSTGTEINMTAKAIGNNNAEYQYWVKDKNGWQIVKDYSKDTTFTYIPKEAGDYRFTVRTRTIGSNKPYEALKGIDFNISKAKPISGVEFILDKESGVSAGIQINMSAKAIGGSNAEYQYWVKDKNGWSIVKDYSKDTTFKYIPEEAGDYRFTVRTRTIESNKPYEALKGIDFKVTNPKSIKSVEYQIDKESGIKSGTELIMTAKAIGGSNAEYQYWVKDKNGWSIVKDYSKDTTFKYIPKEAGDYRFTVRTRTIGSKKPYEALKGIDFKVIRNKVEKVEINIDKKTGISIGNSIKLTANSIGSKFPEYQFLVEINGNLKVIKDYSDQNELGFYIAEKGRYKFIVKARTKGEKVEYESLSQIEYQATDNIKSIDLHMDKPNGVSSGIPIQITTKVVSESPNLEYQYWVQDKNGWKIIKDFCELDSYTYTPSIAGDYRFTVRVRTKGSSLPYEALKGVNYKITGKLSFINNSYNISYEDILTKQMNKNPQDYYYGKGWDSAIIEKTDHYLNPNNFLQFSNQKYNHDIIKVVKVKSNVSSLNVRKEATVESSKVDLIHSNEIYEMSDKKYGWYKIKTNTCEGWIHGAYVNEYYKPRNKDLEDIPSSNQIVGVKGESQNLFPIKIATNVLNVRKEANTNSSVLTQVKYDDIYIVLGEENGWYKIKADNNIGWIFSNYTITTNEVPQEIYQFIDLSGTSYLTEAQLNKILKGKGILEGTGKAFIQAGRLHNVNEIYLISHALLETGNGTSKLSNGSLSVNGKKTYNMFGIGAYDSNALEGGSQFAYESGWFTPEQAIIGGASFISNRYVNNSSYKQNTLYKMRWNPESPTNHQYATDIGWAYKQTSNIKKLYELCGTYSLKFEIPQYMN